MRTKAVEFHCPTLINSSYDQHGRCNGGCMASIRVTQPRGGIEVWQAAYDTSVPISYHGGSIDSLVCPVLIHSVPFHRGVTWPSDPPVSGRRPLRYAAS
eukprot:COSAG03_NODE_1517_length_3945_cov_2.769371_3_plen_99_part_00